MMAAPVSPGHVSPAPGDTLASLAADLRVDLVRVAYRYQASDGDSAHPLLRGVRLEPCRTGGVILVASDGYRMIVMRDRTGVVSRSATVRLPHLLIGKARDLLRSERSEGDDPARVRLTIRDGRVSITGVALEGIVEEVASTGQPYEYLDWRRLIPTAFSTREVKRHETHVAIAPGHAELLATTAQALAHANGVYAREARLTLQSTVEGNVLATFGTPDAFAVVTAHEAMPVYWHRPLWTMSADDGRAGDDVDDRT